ncbi:MAG: FAD-binding oxidoreductase [Terricaulis sp.]|nr:FAD-binding oxidoreductase [Terricaulis sp.]
MRSILIIGGGLIGAASALRLQHAGVRTILIDPGDQRRGASFGNAGHLGPEQVMPWSTWANVSGAAGRAFGLGGALDFRWRDIGLWTPWSLAFLQACAPARVAASHAALSAILEDTMPAWKRLAALAGDAGIVRDHGHMALWMNPARADAGLKAWARTPVGKVRLREWSEAELARYEGVLRARPAAGLFFEGPGQVRDPQGARDAMLAAFEAKGGEIVTDSAVRVHEDGRVDLASGMARQADALLIAAGAWSRPLMAQLGVHAPLIGERGYHVHSPEHAWPEDLPTTFFEERTMVVSRFDSGLRATSFIEFGAPGAPADARKWARLEGHLRALGVRFAANPQRWVGPRPALPDYVPAIGRLKRAPKVLYAFGHAHLGLTMCAVTAELVLALAEDKAPALDIAPYALERFG